MKSGDRQAMRAIARVRNLEVLHDEGADALVSRACGCPFCGCRVMDELVWEGGEDTDHVVVCGVCGQRYVPNLDDPKVEAQAGALPSNIQV